MTEEGKPEITWEDFAKLDLRVGTIKEVAEIEGADKLLELTVDMGKERRTIVAGIKKHYSVDELVGKQIVVVANLEPRKMKGIDSHGMLLAAVRDDHQEVILVSPEKHAEEGWMVS
jgi:methionyl-tRNA synthetase